MKKLSCFLLLLGVLFLCGCVKTVVVSEVMQQGENDRLHTKYNIFYTDPNAISCLNFVEGNIIPYGTEIEVIECNEVKLVFKTRNDEQPFTILFSKGERMTSMQQYLRSLLTFKNRDELSADIRKEYLDKVRNGEVVYGMNRKEISVSWGDVPPVHTPDAKNITWIYMKNHHDLIRLIFRGDILRTSIPKLQEVE